MTDQVIDGQPAVKPVQFPIDKLMDASSCAKKLLEKSTEKDGRLWFADGEIELTPVESAILKDLFDKHTEWGIQEADIVVELQELFKGK